MALRLTPLLTFRASRLYFGGHHEDHHGGGHGDSQGGIPNKFENHIYRDASGQPWFDLHNWELGRKPGKDDLEHPGRHQSLSQTARLVNITFVDRNGDAHAIKCEPESNLAQMASLAGVDLDWMSEKGNEGFSAWSHMIVSSPHFEMLVPPDHREDKYLWDLEQWGTSHRNSRVIKFLFVKPWMDGMVITHPLYADVVTPNFADPFTGRVEDKDQAAAPTYFVSKVRNPEHPDYKFPSPVELLWAGIDTYEQLWDYVRQGWLKRLAAKKAKEES